MTIRVYVSQSALRASAAGTTAPALLVRRDKDRPAAYSVVVIRCSCGTECGRFVQDDGRASFEVAASASAEGS